MDLLLLCRIYEILLPKHLASLPLLLLLHVHVHMHMHILPRVLLLVSLPQRQVLHQGHLELLAVMMGAVVVVAQLMLAVVLSTAGLVRAASPWPEDCPVRG